MQTIIYTGFGYYVAKDGQRVTKIYSTLARLRKYTIYKLASV